MANNTNKHVGTTFNPKAISWASGQPANTQSTLIAQARRASFSFGLTHIGPSQAVYAQAIAALQAGNKPAALPTTYVAFTVVLLGPNGQPVAYQAAMPVAASQGVYAASPRTVGPANAPTYGLSHSGKASVPSIAAALAALPCPGAPAANASGMPSSLQLCKVVVPNS